MIDAFVVNDSCRSWASIVSSSTSPPTDVIAEHRISPHDGVVVAFLDEGFLYISPHACESRAMHLNSSFGVEYILLLSLILLQSL